MADGHRTGAGASRRKTILACPGLGQAAGTLAVGTVDLTQLIDESTRLRHTIERLKKLLESYMKDHYAPMKFGGGSCVCDLCKEATLILGG